LAVAISWIVYNSLSYNTSANTYWPFFVFTPLSIAAWFAAFYFNNKDIQLVKGNVDKKYIKMYYIAQILFFVLVIISTVAFSVFVEILGSQYGILDLKWGYTISLIVTAITSLVVIWMNKYSTYCIEYEIYKKRYGEKNKK
ncbi:MAG: hypothetical protein LBV48_01835, partial [Mycoplasmataceae bacterium]|nr:hypothetical protein [Mycoplasmataceae bacterium]